MFDEVDEALRAFLTHELPIKNGEIDISFDPPRREWAARLNRPTINAFLFQINENARLRQMTMADRDLRPNGNSVTAQRRPIRLDLTYLLTAWASQIEDEHRLLGRIAQACFRHLSLPAAHFPETAHDVLSPVMMQVGQTEHLLKPNDLWSVLSNDLRPSLVLTLTVSMQPFAAVDLPLVRQVDMQFAQPALSRTASSAIDTTGTRGWVSGVIHSAAPLRAPRLFLCERNMELAVKEDGSFIIQRLPAGAYTLELQQAGAPPRQFVIHAPAEHYELSVEPQERSTDQSR